METRVYQKEQNVSLIKLIRQSVSDIYTSRFLSRQLAIRDISAQYRQSYFGILWAFISPLSTAIVWIILNLSGTINLTDTGIPYPIYAFTGTLIWSILNEAINSPLNSTNAAKGIMSKINFPKEALLVSGIYKMLFNSAIKLLLLVVFLLLFGVGLHWSLLLFPLVIFGIIAVGTTIGLFITPLGMLYKDVAKVIAMGLSLMMYATPVVYAIPKEGLMRTIMLYNPFTALVVTARDVATGMTPSFLSYYFVILAVSLMFFLIGLIFYRISIPIIVERMSA